MRNWQTDLLDDLLSNDPVLIGDLILAEVLQGFCSDDDFEVAKTCLNILPFRKIGGYEIALQSAQNYRLLRKKGVTVRKTIDVIIGTFAFLKASRCYIMTVILNQWYHIFP
jgi:hypothetical protein